MTDPDTQQLNDLAKAAMVIYVMLEDERPYFMTQTHKDNPEIGVGEIVTLTITRRHIPPQHPLPVMDAAKVLIPA